MSKKRVHEIAKEQGISSKELLEKLGAARKATRCPPRRPPIIHGMAACGVWECDKPQVHAAVTTTKNSNNPVLFTVP